MSAISTQPQRDDRLDAEIDPIRVEPLSTRMPVHQLAKGGDQDIRIIERKLDGGQISLYWKVDPNPAVGRPGQLAYHLDTLVIKRRLDQLRRPLPRLIRVGDLRQIARELKHGGDTTAIKRAFEQNASAFIRAKVTYRAREGRQVTIEAYFNRYNVFFRGQGLPGGRVAETVYISLNDPYYGMLNNSDWRPLDYEYLKGLAPAAQRFYELVSPKIYAALKNRRPRATIRYSDYCQFAVQKRQPTRRRMQIQMAPIHRQHLKSTYLAQVGYRATASDDGGADWFIDYVPGPRACAEHQAFNVPSMRPSRAERTGADTFLRPSHRPLAGRTSTGNMPPSDESPAHELARCFYLLRHGSVPQPLTPSQLRRAETVLQAAGGDEALARMAVELAAQEGRHDRGGFPSHVGGVLEGTYLDRARQARDASKLANEKHEQLATERARRAAYEAWCRRRAERRIAALSTPERSRLIEEASPTIRHEYRYYLARQCWSDERVRDWVASKILTNYGRQGEPAYSDWCTTQEAAAAPSQAPDPPLH